MATTVFTLSWTHSVEKTRWEEDWKLKPAGLQIITARVKGSGAGMEPAPDAILVDGWWTYRPAVPIQNQLVLAASGATVSGWQICGGGKCRTIGTNADEPVVLKPCDG
ncbi:DUF1850 domain-containing protein [Mesorhizobium sp. NBSH29]|uniref:DUF1850 domain-containing protein n=1 Tax=Mesorhizobium sp. NBSH29 TaxID=2654249 RepID=UPI00215639D8|nr:DUF1850 domain-containing protein [Mesorhizobium sp. NBSH29]